MKQEGEGNLLPSSKTAWERAQELLSEEPFDFKTRLTDLHAVIRKHKKELRAGESIAGHEWVDREFEHTLGRFVEDFKDAMITVD